MLTDRMRFVVPSLLVLLTLAACGDDSDGVGVSVSGSDLPMLIQTQREFTAEVSGSDDQSVTWSLQEGATAGTITASGRYTAGTTPGIYHVVATAGADGHKTDAFTVNVKGFGTPTPFGFPAYGAAVNGAGKVALADNNAKIRFLGTAPGDTVTVDGTPVHVAYNPAGTQAYTGLQSDNAIVRVQVSPAVEMNRVAFGHPLYNLAVNSAGTALYVTTATGWLFKVHPTTLAKQDSIPLASASNGLAFDPAGDRLYVSTISAGMLYAIDPVTMAKVDSFDVGGGAQRVAVAPSGDSVYVANESAGGVVVVRPSTGTVTTKFMDGTPYGIALSADGAALYVTLRTDESIRILGRPGLDSLTTISVGGTPRNVAVDPKGNFVVVTTETNAVKLQ